MIRERLQRVRAELVAIDDNLYRSVCLFENQGADTPTLEPVSSNPTQEVISETANALRGVISLLLRVIDSLP